MQEKETNETPSSSQEDLNRIKERLTKHLLILRYQGKEALREYLIKEEEDRKSHVKTNPEMN